jgi:phospholipase/carboxylesterase
MVTLSHEPQPNLSGKPVLIVSGASDPIIPAMNAGRLASMLKQAGAAVEHRTLPVGHELSQADVSVARAWLEKNEALATESPGSAA